MEKSPEIKNNIEMVKEKIRQKISIAVKNAPDLETIQLKSINKNEDQEIIELIKKATITVNNLYEFKLLMEILEINDETINDTLSHENAHANKATIIGVEHLNYNLAIFIEGNDYVYQPYTGLGYPDEWSPEKIKEMRKKIIKAPEEYNNKLSPIDKERLGNL